MTTGVPISELGAATLPLDGTEQVPLVQDNVTRRASVASIAAASGIAEEALPVGTTNNLVVADIETATRLGLTLAGDADLTGMVPPASPDGKRMMLVNRSAAFTLTVLSNTTSTAANRFISNGDIIVPPLCGAEYVYDGDNQRWVKT